MVFITVQLNFSYALSFIFLSLWQLLVENGARSQISVIDLEPLDRQLDLETPAFRPNEPQSLSGDGSVRQLLI